MKHARKPLFGLIALSAALAMPAAFAQDASTAAQDPATAPQPAAQPESQSLTWADLDVDGNGTLSKVEAGNVQSLAQVIDDADTDKNGELTPDEYQAIVAKSNEQQPEASGGSD